MLTSNTKTTLPKGGFSPQFASVRKIICYAFEGHVNVSWGSNHPWASWWTAS